MLLKAVKKLTVRERFDYWISEREKVRREKKAGRPKPWTDDEILRSYRFCNVRRMDDKVSVWLLKNWYNPYYGGAYIIYACVVARHFNLPETLERIGCPSNIKYNHPHEYADHIIKTLIPLREQGVKLFNNAYVISGCTSGNAKVKHMTKVHGVVDGVLRPMIDDPPTVFTDSLQKTVESFMAYKGIASFMAGQIVMDLRWAKAGEWKDRFEYAPVGPGSSRGMCRLLGRNPVPTMKQKEFQPLLKTLTSEVRAGYPHLEAMDVQNCLCEFDKYERTLWGEGKPKNTYPGK